MLRSGPARPAGRIVERAIIGLVALGMAYLAVAWPLLDTLLDAVTDGDFDVPLIDTGAGISAGRGTSCSSRMQ